MVVKNVMKFTSPYQIRFRVLITLKGKRMNLTPKDLEKGNQILKFEHLKEVTSDSVFAAGIYCILSSREFFEKQVAVYHKLEINNMITPKEILADTKKLRECIVSIRAPNQTHDRLIGYAYLWLHSNIPNKLIIDANNGHDKGIFFRNKLAEEVPGMGLKISSLVLIKAGYENISALDVWLLRWLKKEFNFKSSGNKENIVNPKEYLEAEKLLEPICEEFSASQALIQCSIWGKSANWMSHYQKNLKEF